MNNLLEGDESIKRDTETELYLKYENKNVTIYVCIIDDDVENYYYLAKDENGEIKVVEEESKSFFFNKFISSCFDVYQNVNFRRGFMR